MPHFPQTIIADDLDTLVPQVNEALSKISDRLDAREGYRGFAKVSDDLTVEGQLLVIDPNGNLISGFVRAARVSGGRT